ncbi:MFS transporter [Acidocella aquatica]|uniref:MFS transporter n=1 Tax=Acidocella aquatica TaxID=1922313 RepID=A0ABQ6ABQ3_9PROT|nr:MFS transporter [Acidocella aquatica]GLR68865.1 MFS transporter [Acidocella aquatica]
MALKKIWRGEYAGMAVFALAMGGFAIGTTEFGAMGLVPYFSSGLSISPQQAGNAISAYALGVVVGAPVLAVAVAHLPRRNVLVGLMVAFALANGLSGFAPDYRWMLAFRFAAGLPHGAYFGVASLVASEMVPLEQRAQAIARVLLGLTIATIVGVPLADFIGQMVGWRWAFALVAMLALATAFMVLRFVPVTRVALHDAPNPLAELRVLKRPQVWLTLGIGAIGFGGMFAVYTYLASTLLLVTKASSVTVPVMLGIFGFGLTIGNLVSAWFADKALMPTVAVVLVWSAAGLALYPFMTHAVWSMAVAVFLIGCGGGLATPLQARLMQVAEGAQTLAAALNHSAFNIANALGPWLAGMAIGAGFGWGVSGWVGCGLALAGLALWCVAVVAERRAGVRLIQT